MTRSELPQFAHRGRVVFVSDVHLYFDGAAYQAQFVAFLKTVAASAEAIYVHGDLFDFYVGPRQGRLGFYAPLVAAFEELARAGVRVTLLHGNRDFLIGDAFTARGTAVVGDALRLRLGALDVHLSHGDAFCIHDQGYQFWARGVLRAAPIRALVRSLPVPVGVWLARRYRAVSRRKAKAQQGQSRLPTVFDGVRNLLRSHPFDAVICGHIHDLKETVIEEGGRRALLFTTGAWEEGPNYIEWDGDRLQVRRFAASGADQPAPA